MNFVGQKVNIPRIPVPNIVAIVTKSEKINNSIFIAYDYFGFKKNMAL